jgi:hypothetical protein
MLVLSDMSGPSMQPGFDEYLTAYPLPGTELFVLAKTWYAPEMQRPGCVWTHSLIILRSHIARVACASLLGAFRRPQLDGVESAATKPVEVDEASGDTTPDAFADRGLAAAMIGAVLGQPRPVIVVAETASQFEALFLRLWEELWPAERTRFSFCTGALMPRANAGALLDLQAVPRAIPPSQFRKSASSALVLDLRTPSKPEAWVDLVLDGAVKGDATFRTWLEAAAGADAGRAVVPSLAPIFGEWHAPGSSARSALMSVVRAKDLEAGARSRLIGMVFDRAYTESGAAGRRDLLQVLCAHRDQDLAPIASMLEDQTKRLFEESRADGVMLVLSLLGGELTDVGERLLRTAVLLLVPNDVETFGDAQAPFLPTIVGANPALAQSPILWQRVGSRAIDVLSQLGAANLEEDARGAVIDAIFSSGRDVSVDAIVRFGGKVAIIRALSALASSAGTSTRGASRVCRSTATRPESAPSPSSPPSSRRATRSHRAELFRLFVTLSMYQALRDVVIMRQQRSLPRASMRVVADAATGEAVDRAARLPDAGLRRGLRGGCDVVKDGDDIDCGTCPGESCHVKDATRVFNRMGDMGKLPTSAWLRLWQGGGCRRCSKRSAARSRRPRGAPRSSWSASRAVHRVGRKLATMFVSALSTPALAPGLTPWFPEIDGNELVVVDTNVARAVRSSRGSPRGARAGRSPRPWSSGP